MTRTTPAGRLFRPLLIAAVGLGAASLIANIVWNCNSCGWDLDGVPWYQGVLVAAVPFVITPFGVLGLAVRAAFLRSRGATLEAAVGSAGLALPWLYFLIGYVRVGI